jgi:hypothetical protein
LLLPAAVAAGGCSVAGIVAGGACVTVPESADCVATNYKVLMLPAIAVSAGGCSAAGSIACSACVTVLCLSLQGTLPPTNQKVLMHPAIAMAAGGCSATGSAACSACVRVPESAGYVATN